MFPLGYVAYIDEAGDDGLKAAMRPNVPRGVSEWLVISAVVVRIENDGLVLPWVREAIQSLDSHQMTHIHFRNLRDDKKEEICHFLSNIPVRIFSVISNKQNMKEYKNLNAEKAKINKTAWFYCWMTRILMERISKFCAYRALRDHGSHPGLFNADQISLYARI